MRRNKNTSTLEASELSVCQDNPSEVLQVPVNVVVNGKAPMAKWNQFRVFASAETKNGTARDYVVFAPDVESAALIATQIFTAVLWVIHSIEPPHYVSEPESVNFEGEIIQNAVSVTGHIVASRPATKEHRVDGRYSLHIALLPASGEGK